MPKYDEFKSMTMGKGYDIDGFYGNQCWDGYAKYCQFLGVPVTHCQPSGYVKSIWEERKKNGILKSFDEVEKLQPGDVVIFKEHPATPLSHVALFDHDAGGGYGWFYGQNQGGYNGAFNTVKLPYAATYKTAFRLKDPVKKDEPKKDPVREIADAGSGSDGRTTHYIYTKVGDSPATGPLDPSASATYASDSDYLAAIDFGQIPDRCQVDVVTR